MSCTPNTIFDEKDCQQHNQPALDIRQECLSTGLCKMDQRNVCVAKFPGQEIYRQTCNSYNMKVAAKDMEHGLECLSQSNGAGVRQCKWKGR